MAYKLRLLNTIQCPWINLHNAMDFERNRRTRCSQTSCCIQPPCPGLFNPLSWIDLRWKLELQRGSRDEALRHLSASMITSKLVRSSSSQFEVAEEVFKQWPKLSFSSKLHFAYDRFPKFRLADFLSLAGQQTWKMKLTKFTSCFCKEHGSKDRICCILL